MPFNAKVAPIGEDSDGYRPLIGHPRFHRPYRCCQLLYLLVHIALAPVYLALLIIILVIVLPIVYCCVPSIRPCIRLFNASVVFRILKFLVCLVIEKFMPMFSSTYSRIPLDVEEITVEYLNSLPGLRGEAPITEIWSKGSANQGAVSEMRFLKLKRSSGADQEVAVKFATRWQMRPIVFFGGLADNEHEMYTTFLPGLPGIDTPACLHSDLAPSTALSILILEKIDGRLFSQKKINSGECPVTTEDVEGICRVFADLHGRYWDVDSLPECDGFVKYDRTFHCMYDLGAVASAWPKFEASMARQRPDMVIPPELERAWALIALDGVSAAWTRRLVSGPLTLTHGDEHWGNIFIREGSDEPGLLDWQCVAKKGPACGFAMNFLTVGNGRWLEENERRLIRDVYLPRLYAGCERARAEYPFDLAWEDYMMGVIHFFKQMVIASQEMREEFMPMFDILAITLDMLVRNDICGFLVKFIEDNDIIVAAENRHLLEPEKIELA